MKNEMMMFEGNDVEVLEFEGKVLFNPKDVSEILDIKNVRDNMSRMNEKQVVKLTNSIVGKTDFRKLHNTGENFLTESGVYKLIMRSNKPNAERFQDWVVDEVLPSIHKNGGYIANQENMTSEQFLAQAVLFSQKIIAEKDAMLLEAKPKVEYYDKVLASTSEYTTTQIAKECFMSGRHLNSILHQDKVQYKQNGQWLLYAEHQDEGYVKTRTVLYKDSKGEEQTKHTTVWTEKGREFILDLVEGL